MKKMNNKGFSLVELIIVIAIMAILAAAIAPALIRYIDKSRKANDVSSAKTIKTACDTALANEDANSEIAPLKGKTLFTVSAGTISANEASEDGAFLKEVKSTLSSVPKVSYTKEGATQFVVKMSDDGNNIQVYVAGDGETAQSWQLQPSIDATYK